MLKRGLQLILYIPIQILFIPLAIIGLFIGMYKEMVIGEKMNVSFSAIKALQYRWTAHYFGIRPDPYSVAFIKKLSCESRFSLWSLMGALILSKHLFGFTTNATKLVEPEDTFDATAITRVRVFDRIMDKYINEVEQVVLPGVGFDLIALKYSGYNDLKFFELDQKDTLDVKIETLKKAVIKHEAISFIPVDYEHELWSDKLLEAGFDKTKKTLFLWQSVSLFLDAATVQSTLKKMSELCSGGSIIAQDFYSKAFLNGSISKMAKKQFNLFQKQGETVRFGLDMSDNPQNTVENFLNQFGLKMTDYIQFGKSIGIEPFYCIVEAKKL